MDLTEDGPLHPPERLTMCKTASLRWTSRRHLPTKVNYWKRIDDEMSFHTRRIHSPKWVAVGHTIAFTCADRYTADWSTASEYQSRWGGMAERTKNPDWSLQITCSNSSFLPWPCRLSYLQLELFVSKPNEFFLMSRSEADIVGVFKSYAVPLVQLGNPLHSSVA